MSLPPLYPHQQRTIDAARRAYVAGARRMVLVLPCGAGKTRTATELVSTAIAKGKRVLWLAHREELVDQAADSLAQIEGARGMGTQVGFIKAGRASHPTAQIQVASVQTLHSQPDRLPPADIIVSDECHHDKASTREALYARYPAQELVVFGLTATPERGDGQPLGERSGGVYQHLIVGASVAELQRTPRDMREPNGPTILVPFDVVGPAKFQKELFREPVPALFEFGRRPDGSMRPALLFASSLPASRKIKSDAIAAGLRAEHVDGNTDELVRARAFRDLREGRLDLLTNVLVATEGTDLPNVEIVGVARGCSAESTWIQLVMRGGRSSPSTGKERALLIDFRGHSHVHGLMDDETRKFSLDGRAISRDAPEDGKPALRDCKACGAVFAPQARCPRCGLELPVQHRKQEVKHAQAVTITKDNITPQSVKRAYFDDLCRKAREAGWKPAAVGMRFKGRFGYWPPWPLPKGAAA